MQASDRQIDVTVRLDNALSGRFDEIVLALRKTGMVDVQAHRSFMIVNGRITPDRLEDLRSVSGVQAVRQDTTYGAIAGDKSTAN